MQQKFISDKIAIIGIGLIGASIALHKHKNSYRVGLYNYNADVRQEARQLSIGDEVCEDLAKAVARAGLIILAVPVGAMASVCRQ